MEKNDRRRNLQAKSSKTHNRYRYVCASAFFPGLVDVNKLSTLLIHVRPTAHVYLKRNRSGIMSPIKKLNSKKDDSEQR